ncbi:MAG: DNA starvation/stationary phase protection protein Dps [Candidatus Eisenbacteria bacterium]
MNSTRNDMKATLRGQMVDLLNVSLAELIDLSLQTKQAHWNVKGPEFIALHKLFDELTDSLHGLGDTVAERITALGGTALGTTQNVAETSELTPYPVKIKGGAQHVKALTMAFATCGARVRKAIDVAAKAGDAGTTDVFTEVSRALDKQLWFIEAHTQAKD